MNISFETQPFTEFNKLKDKELQKKIDVENNPRVKELLEKINSSSNDYEIIQLCARVNEHDPDNFMAFVQEADTFFHLGEFDMADESYQKAIQKTKGTSAIVCGMYAFFLFSTGDSDRALDYCKQTIQLENNFEGIHWLKGMICSDVGKHEEAVECFDIAISQNMGDNQAWGGKCEALIQLGRTNDAVECVQEAVKLRRSNITVLARLGYYSLSEKNYLIAKKFFSDYLSIEYDQRIAKELEGIIEKLNQSK